MRNILVRRGVYPRTISPEPRKGLGSPTDNSVRSADAIELKLLYVGHICIKRVIEGHLEGHLGGHLRDTWGTFISDSCIFHVCRFCFKNETANGTANRIASDIDWAIFFIRLCFRLLA